jgi:uncharacterized protein
MNHLLDDNTDNYLSKNSPETAFTSAVQPPQYPDENMHPLAVLSVCAGFFILGNLICGGIILGLAKFQGIDFTQFMSGLNENSAIGDRNFVRAVLFLNHLFSFILPAIGTVIFVYKHRETNYLRLTKLPDWRTVQLAFLILIFSVPLVQYSYLLNKMIPLPQWMRGMEQDTSRMLEAILKKDYWYEAVLNIFLIGVIPAIGEELVFRGILQQQLEKLLKNEHVTVWVSAAIFSAIHMQFEGFFARMILGALLGYLFVWTRNLWIPMIVHLLNNSLQIIAMYAANIKPEDMEKMSSEDKMTWWMALISLVLVVIIGYFIKEHQKKLRADSFEPSAMT